MKLNHFVSKRSLGLLLHTFNGELQVTYLAEKEMAHEPDSSKIERLPLFKDNKKARYIYNQFKKRNLPLGFFMQRRNEEWVNSDSMIYGTDINSIYMGTENALKNTMVPVTICSKINNLFPWGDINFRREKLLSKEELAIAVSTLWHDVIDYSCRSSGLEEEISSENIILPGKKLVNGEMVDVYSSQNNDGDNYKDPWNCHDVSKAGWKGLI